MSKETIDRNLNKNRTNNYSCPIPKGYKPGNDLPVNLTDKETGIHVASFVFTASQVETMKRVRFLARKDNNRWVITWLGCNPKKAII